MVCDNENGYFGDMGKCGNCEATWVISLKLLLVILFTTLLLYLTVKGVSLKQESYVITRVLRIVFFRVVYFTTNSSSQIKILISFLQNLALIIQILNTGPKVLVPLI